MAHARDVDIKRGINEQFKEIYPHINITLSKIRRFEHVFSIMCSNLSVAASKGKWQRLQ